MDKLALTTLVTVLFITPVMAQHVVATQQSNIYGPTAASSKTQTHGNSNSSKGGFAGPDASRTTVDKLISLENGDRVILEGIIERRKHNDVYVFRDSTGVINVDIDKELWRETIEPKDKVQLKGKIYKEGNTAELDVRKVIKMQ